MKIPPFDKLQKSFSPSSEYVDFARKVTYHCLRKDYFLNHLGMPPSLQLHVFFLLSPISPSKFSDIIFYEFVVWQFDLYFDDFNKIFWVSLPYI